MRKLIAIHDFTVNGVHYKKGDAVDGFHGLPRADQFVHRKHVKLEAEKSPRQHVEHCKLPEATPSEIESPTEALPEQLSAEESTEVVDEKVEE